MSSTNSKIDEFGRNIKTCEENLLKSNIYIDSAKPNMVEKLGRSVEKIKGVLVSDIVLKLDLPPMTELDQPPTFVINELNKI